MFHRLKIFRISHRAKFLSVGDCIISVEVSVVLFFGFGFAFEPKVGGRRREPVGVGKIQHNVTLAEMVGD